MNSQFLGHFNNCVYQIANHLASKALNMLSSILQIELHIPQNNQDSKSILIAYFGYFQRYILYFLPRAQIFLPFCTFPMGKNELSTDRGAHVAIKMALVSNICYESIVPYRVLHIVLQCAKAVLTQ